MQRNRSPSAKHSRGPSRLKRTLLTYVGLAAPVYFIPPALESVLPSCRPAIVLASLALIVPLMSYVIMPALQWLFAPARRDCGDAHRARAKRHCRSTRR